MKLQTLPIIREISDSNLETGRIDDFDPLTIDLSSQFVQVLGIRILLEGYTQETYYVSGKTGPH